MIHLGIDAVGAKHGGASVVLQSLVKEAVEIPSIGHITVFCSPSALRKFELPREPRVTVVDVDRERPWARLSYYRSELALEVTRRGIEVLLCVSGAAPRGINVPLCVLLQQALVIEELSSVKLNWIERVRLFTLRRLAQAAVTEADLVLVQTETMRRAVIGAWNTPTSKINIARPTILPSGSALVRRPEKTRVLYVGNTSSYKNLNVLFHAIRLVTLKDPDATLVGTWPAHTPPRDLRVHSTGYLQPEALSHLYTSSTCLVMPSVCETVCLPLLEAMAMGLPIIVADLPYAREICGDAALYFQPSRADELAAQILELSTNRRVWHELHHAGLALTRVRRAEWPQAGAIAAVLASIKPHLLWAREVTDGARRESSS